MYNKLLKIIEYKGYLIISYLDINSPKISLVGTGTLISGFNSNDILISNEALKLLKNNLKINKLINDPVLEIISKDRLWVNMIGNIIIPPNEIINTYTIPYHTICENTIDEKIKIELDKI